ncbi:recombinase family protein [Paenibacillus sp. FSL L8-0502]|uniref:recombinase family protein n=1 Tax=Paenibacillus sp. FSL L8-0502 TaxID=2954619 RepID=UPI0031592D42
MTEQTEFETPQDMLLEGMLEVISEFSNANLATEVRKGMTQNAKQGYNNGGTPPYGYRTEHIAMGNQKTKSVWVPGPREEVDLIRWIFNQYAFENKGYHKIASELNEQKVPTQKGGTWSASTSGPLFSMNHTLEAKCGTSRIIKRRGGSGEIAPSGLLQRMLTLHSLQKNCLNNARRLLSNATMVVVRRISHLAQSQHLHSGCVESWCATNADQGWLETLHLHIPRAADKDIMYAVVTCGKARNFVHM